jgi:type I restriction enzyme S subunit
VESGYTGEIGTIIGGATPSKLKSKYFSLPETNIAWITPKDLSNNKNKFISHGELDITDEAYSSCSTKLMPKGSVLFSSRAPIGYLAIAENELCTNQGFKSIIPNKDVGTEFVYLLLKQNLQIIESLSSGSTFKEISGTVMNNVKIVIPTNQILKKFEFVANIIFKRQNTLEKESRTLAAIRDALLPKLMSGEIEVEVEHLSDMK